MSRTILVGALLALVACSELPTQPGQQESAPDQPVFAKWNDNGSLGGVGFALFPSWPAPDYYIQCDAAPDPALTFQDRLHKGVIQERSKGSTAIAIWVEDYNTGDILEQYEGEGRLTYSGTLNEAGTEWLSGDFLARGSVVVDGRSVRAECRSKFSESGQEQNYIKWSDRCYSQWNAPQPGC